MTNTFDHFANLTLESSQERSLTDCVSSDYDNIKIEVPQYGFELSNTVFVCFKGLYA